jgi:hypothetical protein
LQLHPTQWSVFGNSPLSKEDELHMQMVWGSTQPYGSARPLFVTRSTSGAEGEMNRMLKRCFRSNGEDLGTKCHKRSNAVSHNHSSVVLQDLQSNKDSKKYNMDLGIGVIESVSNKQKCSRCRLIGHNATSCHLPPAEDNKNKDQMSDKSPLEPGESFMGEDTMVPLVQTHCQRVKAELRINDTDFFFPAQLTQSNDIGPFLECSISLHHFQKAMCLVSDATQNLSGESYLAKVQDIMSSIMSEQYSAEKNANENVYAFNDSTCFSIAASGEDVCSSGLTDIDECHDNLGNAEPICDSQINTMRKTYAKECT